MDCRLARMEEAPAAAGLILGTTQPPVMTTAAPSAGESSAAAADAGESSLPANGSLSNISAFEALHASRATASAATGSPSCAAGSPSRAGADMYQFDAQRAYREREKTINDDRSERGAQPRAKERARVNPNSRLFRNLVEIQKDRKAFHEDSDPEKRRLQRWQKPPSRRAEEDAGKRQEDARKRGGL